MTRSGNLKLDRLLVLFDSKVSECFTFVKRTLDWKM